MLKYFFPRLRERVNVTNLRCLTVNFDHLDPSLETRLFMDRVAQGLETLHIQFGNNVVINAMTEQFLDTLQLELCTSLTSFEITLPGDSTSIIKPRLAWSLLTMILPKLSQTVQNFTINHKLNLEALESDLRHWEWSSLDHMLCGFQELNAVTIRSRATNCLSEMESMYIFDTDDALMFWKYYMERSKRFFTPQLPKLSDRKVLSFDF